MAREDLALKSAAVDPVAEAAQASGNPMNIHPAAQAVMNGLLHDGDAKALKPAEIVAVMQAMAAKVNLDVSTLPQDASAQLKAAAEALLLQHQGNLKATLNEITSGTLPPILDAPAGTPAK